MYNISKCRTPLPCNDMILKVDSDASYLIAPEAKSRRAGYFHLHYKTQKCNAPLLVECLTLKHIVTSSAECKTAGVFHNAKVAIPIQYILNEIGHKQPPTPLIMDNNTTK